MFFPRIRIHRGSGVAADGEADIDEDTCVVWKSHVGQMVGSSSSSVATATVSAPTTLVMCLFGIGAAVYRRRAASYVEPREEGKPYHSSTTD